MKKLAIWLVVAGAGVFLVQRTDLASYASTLWTKLTKGAKKHVPLDFEFDRIEGEIAKLSDDIDDRIDTLGEKDKAIKKLKKEIAKLEKQVDEGKGQLRAAQEALDKGKSFVTTGDEELDGSDLRRHRNSLFASVKRLESELKTSKELIEARQQEFDHECDGLSEMIQQQRDLNVRLAELRAEEALARASENRETNPKGDGRLARIKQSMEEAEDRVESKLSKTTLRNRFLKDLELRGKAGKVKDEDVRAYLEGKPKAKAQVKATTVQD